MRDNIRLPELLAPAGSFDHLVAAVKAGADAVYMGGSRFGARAYADNFQEEEMVRAIHYAHFYHVKLYMTVNTLMKEEEIHTLYDFLLPYYEAGLDGVIVQDIGAMDFIHKNFPGMEVHGSTQMTITDSHGANAAKRLGACRVVPARELSLAEISKIKEDTGLDLEIFVHGALCYCYSGQCLFSSFYGGRSGNRGRCAQPCRMRYRLLGEKGKGEASYLLSPRDLNAIDLLPDLIRAGVDSLKIEGRMKSVEFVAGVTRIYRKYLDWCKLHMQELDRYQVSKEDHKLLLELYSRGGFTDGYFKQHNGSQMMSTRYPKNMGRPIGTIEKISRNRMTVKVTDPLYPKDILVIPYGEGEEIVLTGPEAIPGGKRENLNVPKSRQLKPGMTVFRRRNAKEAQLIAKLLADKKTRQVDLTGFFQVGKEAMVTLTSVEDPASDHLPISVTISGDLIETSVKHPLTEEEVRKQFEKTGNVPFSLGASQIMVGDSCFYPSSRLKHLRQEAYERLEEEIMRQGERKAEVSDSSRVKVKKEQMGQSKLEKLPKIRINVMVCDNITLGLCSVREDVSGVILDGDYLIPEKTMIDSLTRQGKKVYLSLPRMIRGQRQENRWSKMICDFDWDGVYVNNIDQAEMVHDLNANRVGDIIPMVIGPNGYVWNRYTREAYRKLYGDEILSMVLPYEMSEREQEAAWKDTETAIHKEVIVYGRVPIMISAQCPKATLSRCDHQREVLRLRDSSGGKKDDFWVSTHCDPEYCYTQIYSDTVRDLIGEDFGNLFMPGDGIRIDSFSLNEKELMQILDRIKVNFGKQDSSAGREDTYWDLGVL